MILSACANGGPGGASASGGSTNGAGSSSGGSATSSGGSTGAAPACAPFYAGCDAGGLGTCLPGRDRQGQLVGVCAPAGSASGPCQADGGAGARCPVGQVCAPPPLTDGGAICQPGCDPTAPTCPGTQSCWGGQGIFPEDGVCVATGSSGCLDLPGLPSELLPCFSNAECGCPQRCLDEPRVGGRVCERACAGSLECPLPLTLCQGGECSWNFCGRDETGTAVDGGGLGAPCDVLASGDGVCVPFPANALDDAGDPAFLYGICAPSGSAQSGAPCDPTALRDAGPSAFCPLGTLCAAAPPTVEDDFPPFSCEALCDPLEAGRCPSATDGGAQGCFPRLDPPLDQTFGACAACTRSGELCAHAAQCCSGTCARPDAGVPTCG